MIEREELAYERGHTAAWQSLLSECLRNLGYNSAECKQHGWITERVAAIASLRSICEDLGDNDWPDDLHLADIIDKHLGDYLLSEEAPQAEIAKLREINAELLTALNALWAWQSTVQELPSDELGEMVRAAIAKAT